MDLQTVYTYLRYVSALINVVVFFYWLKSKVVQNEFLAGRWEGSLQCNSHEGKLIEDSIFNCFLIITKHSNQNNKGLFYYEQKSLERGIICIKGFDELNNYESDIFFVYKKNWKPKFVRLLHYNYNFDESILEKEIVMSKQYIWSCKITSLWFSSKIEVEITGDDVNFVGVFQKV